MQQGHPALTETLDTVVADARAAYGAAAVERLAAFVGNFTGDRRLTSTGSTQRDGKPSRLWFPGLTAKPWHDPADHRWVRDLEAQFPTVRREIEAGRAVQGRFEQPPDLIANQDFHYRGWVNIVFERAGYRNENGFFERYPENIARFPGTFGAFAPVPTVGETRIAILEPGGYLKPHYSVFNAQLVCHMGVDVPSDCGIRVEGTTRVWQPGKVLMFDDTFLHEAWNRGDRHRVILLFTVWHPDLTPVEIAGIRAVLEASFLDRRRHAVAS